ncbi:MAG: hypothetical protein Q9170_007406, partial [Blastenia crenularia]
MEDYLPSWITEISIHRRPTAARDDQARCKTKIYNTTPSKPLPSLPIRAAPNGHMRRLEPSLAETTLAGGAVDLKLDDDWCGHDPSKRPIRHVDFGLVPLPRSRTLMSFNNTNTDILLAGAFAAFTVDFLVYPLDTIKTRLQSPDYR